MNHRKELTKLFIKYFIIHTAFWAIFVGFESIREDKPFFSWKMIPWSIGYGFVMTSLYVFWKWRTYKKTGVIKED